MPSAPTECEACGKVTRTIGGRCPNCGEFKDASLVPPPSYILGGSVWDDIENLLIVGLFFAPGLVLLLLAVFVVGSELLLLIALGALAVPLVGVLLRQSL